MCWIRESELPWTVGEPGSRNVSQQRLILSYLCAGRPIVGVMPDENDAAKTFRESGGGDVVPPARGEEAAAAVLALLGDERQRLAMGAAARV